MEAPVQFKVPVPVPVTWILPVAVPQLAGFETVPNATVVTGFTVTVVEAEVDEHPPALTATV